MTVHAYPAVALTGDYVRGGAGLAITLAPLLFVRLNVYFAVVLATLAAIFAAFTINTVLRQMSRVELSEDGLSTSGAFPARVAWAQIDDVRLGYYSTRRDGEAGWMQLVLRGAGAKLMVDSRIDGFAVIAERAAGAALSRGLDLAPATRANFAALGIKLGAQEG